MNTYEISLVVVGVLGFILSCIKAYDWIILSPREKIKQDNLLEQNKIREENTKALTRLTETQQELALELRGFIEKLSNQQSAHDILQSRHESLASDYQDTKRNYGERIVKLETRIDDVRS